MAIANYDRSELRSDWLAIAGAAIIFLKSRGITSVVAARAQRKQVTFAHLTPLRRPVNTRPLFPGMSKAIFIYFNAP